MIFLDLETTGIDPLIHGIASIGAIDLMNPTRTLYLEPRLPLGKVVDPFALKVNGFQESELRSLERKTLAEILIELIRWTQQTPILTLAGHNIMFDRSFLQTAFKEAELPWNFGFRSVDVHAVAIAKLHEKSLDIPLRNNKYDITLDRAAQLVGLPAEPQPHTALTGAKYAAEVYARLVFHKNLLPEFAQYPLLGSLIE